ncbi:hypothetical protein [Caballeronia sp. BCC1704]|uniref:hypothetical protein n=1 Tax=Caballeronia sp. BCC1704 TaxID=2676300 RepID=UPI001ABB82E0|nr:hypothetical protein [Caballeronia sp. BCC1704]
MSTMNLNAPTTRFADEGAALDVLMREGVAEHDGPERVGIALRGQKRRARPADVRRRGMRTMYLNAPVWRVADEGTALERLMCGGAA